MAVERAFPFSQTFRVRYEECGPDGSARASVYLRYLQELAFAHSAALGYPLSWYEANRLFWLVRRIHLVVHQPAGYGADLLCTTQVVGMRRVMARRHNTIERTGGAPVATAVVDWILTQNGEAPVRVPDEFAAAFPTSEGAVAPSTLQESYPPSGSAPAPLRIRASDADAMGHANHTVYLDLLDDAVIRAGGDTAVTAYPRTYDLQYNAAAPSGADLRDLAWCDGGTWYYRLEAPSGALHLHARLVGASPAASGGV